MVRSVQCAGGKIDKEGLVWRQRVLRLHPGDRLVRHINGKMVIGIVRRFHPDGSIENGRRPLIGLASDKTVKLVETGMRRPTIKRSRNRDLPRRCFVILTEGGRAE